MLTRKGYIKVDLTQVMIELKGRVFPTYSKKSLKIPKGQSESVYRRTDNTMAKRKRTNNDLQNIHIKLKIE